MRNTALDARGFFPSMRLVEHQNEFGFTAGGPVVKKKVFFFFSYDGWRLMAFSCFTPIMEVDPTRNFGFWNLPRTPSYDAELIAIWRLYARLHQRLAEYSYAQAKIAQQTGTPVIRRLLLLEPKALEAWSNWQTYLYGSDLLVSPIWEKRITRTTGLSAQRRRMARCLESGPHISRRPNYNRPCRVASDPALHSQPLENQAG